jgi:hypothetical protein
MNDFRRSVSAHDAQLGVINNIAKLVFSWTSSVPLWSQFLATDTNVPGAISGATRFSEK